MRPEIAREEAWGREIEARQDWRMELTPSDLSELDEVATNRRGESLGLARRIERVTALLEEGPGVALVRGLPVERWGAAGARVVLSYFGAMLGTPLSQSPRGERIFDVRNEGFAPDDPRFRGPSSNRTLRFHTDRCDVIGFLCLTPAQEGGENHVVSSVRLHEELATRPELLETLSEPFPYLRHVVDPGHPRPFVELPVFSFRDGRFAGHLLRVLIDRADASPEAPDLSERQRAALDALDTLADRRELQLRVRLERGDLLFLNNWTTFHRRTSFVDAEEADRRRHLLRIWLSMPNNRPLVEAFRAHFGAVEPGVVRGGMREV